MNEHVTGPGNMQETQIQGYELALGSIQRREVEVLNAIRHKEGATLWELEILLGRPMHAISGRIRRLVQAGKLIDSGLRRKNPKSGVNGTVWVEYESKP